MFSSASETIFSATDFLPACMIEFMNLVTTAFPYFGSGMISRFSALWRRDICQPRFAALVSGVGIRLAVRSTGGLAALVRDPPRPSYYFGRFAPYFDRRSLRFF